jgi:hypothetical protein
MMRVSCVQDDCTTASPLFAYSDPPSHQAAAAQSKNSSRPSTLTCAGQAIASVRTVKLFFKILQKKVLSAAPLFAYSDPPSHQAAIFN